MRSLVLAITLLSASSLAFAQASGGYTKPDRAESDLQAVQQALYEGAEALARNDADALERYYASEWLSVNPTGGAALVSGKGFTSTRNGDLHYTSIEIAEPITRVHGNAAVSTSRVTVKGSSNGQDISGVYRVSTMLVKKNGRWQIVALVSSPAVSKPPAG